MAKAPMIKTCHYKDVFEGSDFRYLPVENNLIEWFDSQVSHITLGDCYGHIQGYEHEEQDNNQHPQRLHVHSQLPRQTGGQGTLTAAEIRCFQI